MKEGLRSKTLEEPLKRDAVAATVLAEQDRDQVSRTVKEDSGVEVSLQMLSKRFLQSKTGSDS